MEDDLIEGLIGLAVLVGICYGIYLFCIYVLPWLLFFALVVVLPGWGFLRLLTTPIYQLTRRSALALFAGVPVAAWGLSVAIVTELDLPAFFPLFVAPSAYYIIALLVLCVWGLWRHYQIYSQIRESRRWLREAERRTKRLETQLEHVRLQIQSLEGNHGGNLERLRRIEAQLQAWCSQEPRTFGLLLNTLNTEVAGLDKSALEAELKRAKAESPTPATTIRVLVLEKQLLAHQSGGAKERLARLREKARRLQEELGHSHAVLQKTIERVKRCEEAKRRFSQKPILL